MTEKPKSRKAAPKRRKAVSKGGRPPYHPSIEDRISVEQMRFCGESENVISRALGIDVDTLRKHLRDELDNGHARRRRQVIGILFKAADLDNIAAAKRLDEMGRVAGADEAMQRRAEQHQERQPKLGKKQEQQAAAAKVGGKYAPPSPPRLIVNNK